MYFANAPSDQNGYRRVIGICFVLLITYYSPLAAQVNIFTGETMRQMQLEPGWYNSINLDLTYRAGNTDLFTARTLFRSDYLSKTYHGFVFGSLQQGRKSGDFFINKGMAHGRIIRSLTQHVLFEGSLTCRLTTKLAFPLRLNFRYDSEPPTGTRTGRFSSRS